MTMRVGICGLGTVGSGLFNLFASNEGEIARKLSAVPQLVQVGCRRDHPDCDLSAVDVTRDVFDVARNPDIDILVELIGGVDTARELVLEAINNGKRNAHHRLKSANAVHNQFRHYEDSDRCACRALCLLYGVARGTRRAFRAAAPPLAGCAHTRRPWPSRRRSARPRRRHALGRVTRPQRY